MDPQKLASLDPKLREAYQRVMETPIPQTPPPPPMPAPNPIPSPAPEPQSIPSTQPSIPEPQPAQPIPNPQPSQPQPPVQPANFDQMNSEVPATPSQNFTRPPAQVQTMAIKKKNSMMPILFGIVGVIFIAIYTLFWAKILNFKLPFLP